MKFFLYYLRSEYSKRLYFTFRQLLFLSLIIGFIFYFAAMWPSVNFSHTATYQHAKYDVFVNGPLKSRDVKNILAFKRKSGSIKGIGFMTGYLDKVFSKTKIIDGIRVFYYAPKDFKRINLSYFSDGLLVEGQIAKSDEWAIDYMTAKKLDIRIGDIISFKNVYSDGKQNRTIRQSGKIAAIYASTNEVVGLLVPLQAEIKKLLYKSTEGVIYADLFLKFINNKNSFVSYAMNLRKDEEWLIQPLAEGYAQGRAAFEQTLNRNIRNATVWISMFIYLIYILREQFLRIDRRKKNLAILFSLGFSQIRIYKLFITEQLILNLSTAAMGFWLGKYLLEDTYGVFIPKETTYFLAGLFIIINVVVLILTIFQLIYRFNRLDVAKLLSSE